MDIQEQFEMNVNNRCFDKVDLTKYPQGDYIDATARIAWTYYLAGFAACMLPAKSNIEE